jgi:deoxyadenosine/deoxycytidine kinase
LDAEQKVDPEYWKLLNQKYEYWYQQWKDKVPFYVIDGNLDDSETLAKKIVNDVFNNI